ncbi:MAG: large-conductance mechanosensitive channel protein MscL [Ruthenibacterium sp.]
MKKFLSEFRDFAMRGNVMDMAVGVVIGGAFTAIVNSLVADVFMPLIGILTGGIHFAGLSFGIGDAQITYGNFLQAIVQFILIAFCVFMIIKAINMLHKKKPEEPEKAPEPSKEELLLTEIRDLLKKQK